MTCVLRSAFTLAAGLWASATLAADPVGRVEAMGGQVDIEHADHTRVAAQANARVASGETVRTGKDGWVVLAMVDGASLTLRNTAALRLDDYRFDAARPTDGHSFLSLLQGALRSVTGAIGRGNPSAFRLTTPHATIGIRGTDFDTWVVEAGDTDVKPGTYQAVTEGETDLVAGGHTLRVRADEASEVSAAPSAVPQHQPRRPAFWGRWQRFDQHIGLRGFLMRLHRAQRNGFQFDPSRHERIERAIRERVENRIERRTGKPMTDTQRAKLHERLKKPHPGPAAGGPPPGLKPGDCVPPRRRKLPGCR